ncbi:hypothetical protein C9I92_07555 [Photobacterium ganghwense]|uniref:trypsin-like peptidase domain-containing protein n=1 Tax=Photobacterium ganghwense TaxID=320778 RepID=UPI00069FF283|nr:trypsin-like peptidase domain-containing protein [Photobacterium ganghwense]PSU09399.1 hypothetical protein C9I92_07555 [Photobacterium ganghwense]QSV16590.1 trypsin-like peptidase domain-containing protein [Photobacterium ganghwense]
MNKNKITIGFITAAFFLTGCQTTMTSADFLYNQYRAKPNNKAYSIGTNNVAGAAWGAETEEEAIQMANKTCIKSGGKNCNVTEVNGIPMSNGALQSFDVAPYNKPTVNNYNYIYQGISYVPDLNKRASGFFISSEHLLTTSQMVDSCTKISFERNGQLHDTTVLRADKNNGLAVLKLNSPVSNYAKISSQTKTKQGDKTYTFGYDLSDVVNSKIPSYQGKITDGIISSALGKNNDIRFMKTTNEINNGNIGGPVVSEYGDVIGIITNINKDAIKSSMINLFLNESEVRIQNSTNKKKVTTSEIAEKSQGFTVPLVCLKQA